MLRFMVRLGLQSRDEDWRSTDWILDLFCSLCS